jgi:hypothetical protein
MGIGDWGLGIGDWGLGPIPKSPIPNPQSPIPIIKIKFCLKQIIKLYFFKKSYGILIIYIHLINY